MKKLCFLLLMLGLVCRGDLFADTLVAVDSCRTSLYDGTVSEADTNKSDTEKLSVRGDYKAAKSWIKFNVGGLNISSLSECQLRITLYEPKTGTCSLSAVDDDCLDNINWSSANLTWNNAPSNFTSSDGVNPDDPDITIAQLQGDLDPNKTTLISTVDYSYGGLAGDQFFFDVLPILQADNDGVVQFVLHGASGNTNFATHTTTATPGEDYYPTLVYSSAVTCPNVGILHSMYAAQSCRTSLYDGSASEADFNKHDSSKLTVRGDYKAAKSWIKFDFSELGLGGSSLRSATLRITLWEPKTNTCLLSSVNDDCLDNIGWDERDLTWNNAPGNYTSSDGINPDKGDITVDQLQDELDPNKTTVISTVDYSYGGKKGDQFFFNVLSAVQADTDGIVQFALHGAGGNTNFATHDNPSGEEYWPRLEILLPPLGADNPTPCPGDTVNTELESLSWTNPDPNDGVSPITCTVYLGTDPNRPNMDPKVLGPDENSVAINTTNFPNFGTLVNETPYFWVVDCDDPSRDVPTIPGLMWDFYVYDNEPPYNVNAGEDQATWMTNDPNTIDLVGTAEDDGLPSGELTITWEETEGPGTSVISNPDQLSTTVSFVERGDYTFTLTADDSELQTTDTVRVAVGDDACDASHIQTGSDYDPGDVNEDCIVNLQDALLFAANWLDCSDTLMNCGN